MNQEVVTTTAILTAVFAFGILVGYLFGYIAGRTEKQSSDNED